MLKKIIFVIISGIILTGIFVIPELSDQFVDAVPRKKIEFTQTITSISDPGQGHENHQLALILSPNPGTLYDGSLTYTASEPVQAVVLHEISKNDARGQPIWTVDGNTVYGLSLFDQNTKSGSLEFTGAALGLHSPNSNPFTATVSVDGWIRGLPVDITIQQIDIKKEEPILQLARANIPVTIPLHLGLYSGNEVHYIITDSSDSAYANIISERQGWKVETAKPLEKTPNESKQAIYVFTNGIRGSGIHGFQADVFSATPEQNTKYSALSSIIEVSWKKGQNYEVLKSTEDIIKAKDGGRVEFKETNVIINTPQISWPNGQMKIRDDKEISNSMKFDGGQITEINKDKMTVTFVAHRGWGPHGQTIYYIVTDATPKGPAEMMGVVYSPTLSKLVTTPAASDLFQLKNGIKGTGPLGFQPGISGAVPGDINYSPMWRIYTVEWNNSADAQLLETKNDIDALKAQEMLSVSIARPLNSEHIINSPFIDPFQ